MKTLLYNVYGNTNAGVNVFIETILNDICRYDVANRTSLTQLFSNDTYKPLITQLISYVEDTRAPAGGAGTGAGTEIREVSTVSANVIGKPVYVEPRVKPEEVPARIDVSVFPVIDFEIINSAIDSNKEAINSYLMGKIPSIFSEEQYNICSNNMDAINIIYTGILPPIIKLLHKDSTLRVKYAQLAERLRDKGTRAGLNIYNSYNKLLETIRYENIKYTDQLYKELVQFIFDNNLNICSLVFGYYILQNKLAGGSRTRKYKKKHYRHKRTHRHNKHK
jgi:hypothetical protein